MSKVAHGHLLGVNVNHCKGEINEQASAWQFFVAYRFAWLCRTIIRVRFGAAQCSARQGCEKGGHRLDA